MLANTFTRSTGSAIRAYHLIEGMAKRILHIDMDAFFASVEIARNPQLRGKPVIVGGNPESSRSVVASASYEARQFGVRSAMPIVQAKKLCPQGVFIRGSHALYSEVSRRIYEVLLTTTPGVQMASIDEANLDITGSIHLFGSEDVLAQHIKDRIKAQEGLTATIGIASNKMVAKIAANMCKPDGYLAIPSGKEVDFLAPLPVETLPGVGPHTRSILESLGILTVYQLAETPESVLIPIFGIQNARSLRTSAWGIGSDDIRTEGIPKSISRETTFDQDVADWRDIEPVLLRLAEYCAYVLREEGLQTKRVTLKVRYSDFTTKTFAHTLSEPTCLDGFILQALRDLLPKAQSKRLRVRLIGVSLSSLSSYQGQLQLFAVGTEEKWERVFKNVDKVRRKLGFDKIISAGALRDTSQKHDLKK